jgi:predicted ribosome quality control (RQC) complex YloA/Tae2 family protein
LSGRQQSEPTIPFRRYELGSGFELWVGRNAAQNDELTTRVSRKFDLWLHARGVGGSHAVLRPPNRTVEIPEETIQRAASIVAYYSKARGSALVPVIVAERKFVRKPRRAEPGMVIVDRHRVVMVEPGLPA